MSAKKKKIAVIGLKGLPAFGGAAAVGENLIEKLKEEYDITVYASESHVSRAVSNNKGYRQLVFRNYGKGGFNTLVYYLKSLLHCLFNSYDLIHLHHAESGFITPFLRMKYKVVVTFHGIYRDDYIDPKFSGLSNKFFKFSEKQNIKLANEVVSVSKPDADYILKKYGKPVRYIPNGISLSGNDPDVDKSRTDYIFFSAGRIYKIKGLHLLLDAAKKLNLKTRIIIAGDLDQVEAYKEEILELKQGLNVEFVGLIRDKEKLKELIRQAKLFVFPSITEAMSMMLLEVVSMKTPVIASDIPANRTVFNDREVLFFESENSVDLAAKIAYALEQEEKLETYALQAYQKLKSEYTWEMISEQYSLIYKSLLNP